VQTCARKVLEIDAHFSPFVTLAAGPELGRPTLPNREAALLEASIYDK